MVSQSHELPVAAIRALPGEAHLVTDHQNCGTFHGTVPFLFSRRVLGLLGVLLVCAQAGGASSCAATSTSAPATFHEVPLGHIPAGQGADRIDVSNRGECCGEWIGCAFLDENGNIYFYDVRQNNLKVLVASQVPRVMVIPGPGVTARNARPTDGVVAADGTIYLLVDCGTTTERYRIHVRAPADTSWRTAEPLDDASIGWTRVAGRRVPARGSVRIGVNPKGQVEVYDFDRRRSAAIIVGDASGVLPPHGRVTLPPGAIGRLGHVVRRERTRTIIASGVGTRTIDTPGVFLGTDAKDFIYLVAPVKNDGGDLLQRYSPGGELVAEVTVPIRPVVRLLEGKAPFQVQPNGDIVQFRVTSQGLEATRWTTEEAR